MNANLVKIMSMRQFRSISNLGHGIGSVKLKVRDVHIIHPNQLGPHHHEYKLQLNDTLKLVFESIDPPSLM